MRGGRFPEVEPVRPPKVARIGLALGPQSADPFLEPLDFIERREQGPRSQRIFFIRNKTQYSIAAAFGRLELEDRLDRLGAGARHMAWRSPTGICPETSRMGSRGMRFQLSKNSLQAVHRPDVPGQGQYIAPMAVGMEQRLERGVVASRKSLLERRKPMVRNRREGLRFSEHAGLGCHGLARLAFIRSVTSMWPGACVMHSEGRASISTDCGVMPQAQKSGSSSPRTSVGSPAHGRARSLMPIRSGRPRCTGAPCLLG